ncbi:MAG: CPBP family intramembrane metalloprotease [Spirochaetes bacterium]|nr:CPBP family intramembrane metalloprotease [Spirochaetota bacterium]
MSLIVPWSLWFIVAWMSRMPVRSGALVLAEQALGLLGLVAPVLAAGYLFLGDRVLLADLKKRLFGVKEYRRIYTVITLLLIPLSLVAAQLLSLLFGHGLEQFHVSGKPSFTSIVFTPWFILIFAPIVEELAWHSYGTDALRRQFNLFATSMIFSVYWVAWHVPLSFIRGYYHSNVVAEGPLYSLNFVFSLFVFVILMNWLYYRTKRSILIAVLFHLSANITNEIFATHPDSKVIQTALLLAVAVIVLCRERRMFFTREVAD